MSSLSVEKQRLIAAGATVADGFTQSMRTGTIEYLQDGDVVTIPDFVATPGSVVLNPIVGSQELNADGTKKFTPDGKPVWKKQEGIMVEVERIKPAPEGSPAGTAPTVEKHVIFFSPSTFWKSRRAVTVTKNAVTNENVITKGEWYRAGGPVVDQCLQYATTQEAMQALIGKKIKFNMTTITSLKFGSDTETKQEHVPTNIEFVA